MSFLEAAAKKRDRTAVFSPLGNQTWGQLAAASCRAGRALRSAGIAVGDRWAFLSGNRAEVLETVIGSFLAGTHVVPINWHLTAPEIAFILTNSGSKLLLLDADHEELGRAAAREAGLSTIVTTGTEYEAWLAAESVEPPTDEGPGSFMLYTSGTTGQPRGVYRLPLKGYTADGFLGALEALAEWYGIREGGVHLVDCPLYHGAPLGFAIYAINRGQSVVISERFDPGVTLDLIETHRVTTTHLVPTQFVRLLSVPEERRRKFDPSSLGCVLHGAAPCPAWVKRAMIEWWGPVIVEYYGASEGVGPTRATSEEWLARPGTVGQPPPGITMTAVGDDGRDMPPGEPGLLYSSSILGPPSYLGDVEKTESIRLSDSRFTAGDIGWIDADGYVFLSDRKVDLIISGGVNIYPAEVEAVLSQHAAVEDCAVFGIPDPEWGEQVKAAVELAPGAAATEVELVDWCRERMARFKCPRTIDFHVRLPRDDMGKLAKRKLRETYWADSGRQI